jgi:hypothetical protein
MSWQRSSARPGTVRGVAIVVPGHLLGVAGQDLAGRSTGSEHQQRTLIRRLRDPLFAIVMALDLIGVYVG